MYIGQSRLQLINLRWPLSGLIDWDYSGLYFAADFATYPLFIIDHPAWNEDNPLRKRNIQDQNTFNEIILEAERNRNPVGGLPLSSLAAALLQGLKTSWDGHLFGKVVGVGHGYGRFSVPISSHLLGVAEI